ncbi:DUF2461 family protein, partial [Arthrospira platensis SPKY1]|nr:DUF2461 family protein [Arthrospira platensis SPKY1]
WEDNKGLYLSAVRQPLELLAQELVDEFGEVRFFRPYRDIRFSKDKTPYKDHQGMYVDLEEGVGWYLQVSAHGLMIAGGWYTTTSEQLSNYREAVAEDSRGQLAVLA